MAKNRKKMTVLPGGGASMSHGPGIGGHVVDPSKSKVRRLCVWERKPEQHVERGWEASGFYGTGLRRPCRPGPLPSKEVGNAERV